MKPLITLLFLALVGWMGGGTWFWVCKVKQLCDEPGTHVQSTPAPATDPEPAVKLPSISPLSVLYNGSPLFNWKENFKFAKSNPSAIIPGSMIPGLDSLANYLKLNPDKDLRITGAYSNGETRPGDMKFENLGLGRADFLRQWLISKGVDPNRLTLNDEASTDDKLFSVNDTLYGGIRIDLFDATPVTKEEEIRLAEAIPINFDQNSSSLPLSPELKEYISEVIRYLNRHPDKKLILTGHTDSQGSANSNIKLGRDRANRVGSYFRQLGAKADQITVRSRGEEKSIASNATEEGRRRNRRVEVQVR